MQAGRNASNVISAAGRASLPGILPCRLCRGLPRLASQSYGAAAFSPAAVQTADSGRWPHAQQIKRRLTLQARAASENGASSNGASSEPEYDYDLFTIGAGSGGTRASRLSASVYGARVGVAEMPFGAIASDTVGGAGGTCVLRGCVPKKLFVYAASFPEEFKEARGFGWDVPDNITQDWTGFLAKKRKELERLHGVYDSMLKKAGCDMFIGRATVVDPHTVEVDGKRYTAKNILIAVGGRAVRIPIEGVEHAIISDDILELEAVPKKLIVIGSGYIGLEFSCIFHNLGAEVHIMFRQDKPLRGFDEEVRTHAMEQYALRGIHLHPGTSPERIVKNDDGSVTLYSKTKDGQEVVETADHVLMATGRKANVDNLGLEKAGVEIDEKSKAVKVDEFSRTTCPSIWAIGDVTDRINLTPVALMEGMALVHHLFGNDPDSRPRHDNVASAVFTTPQIGNVGLTEEEAVKEYPNLNIYKSVFRPMKGTISGNEGKSMMKIIVDADSDRVLGMHMVGTDSPEIMQGMAVGIKMGMTKKQLDSVVGIHPTAAEELVTMREATRKIRARELVKA